MQSERRYDIEWLRVFATYRTGVTTRAGAP
jgi:hypothetical protein